MKGEPIMTKTRVVHCKKEHYDIYIGRPSKWGNPFRVTKTQSRELAIERYKKWLMDNKPLLSQVVPELKGKTLGCWCYPLECHGDVLVEIAEGRTNGAK
jgi:hypothetical protein